MNLDADTSREQAFRAGVLALKGAGIDSPALDAAILLGHVTGETGPGALLSRGEPLSTQQAARYEGFIRKRCQRETVSRILGSREFYSMVFEVNSHVLDPRPETETLVSEALRWLGDATGPFRVMDVGTGSGVIAVTVAASQPDARLVATDISGEALKVAARNAAAHHVSHRVDLVLTDLANGVDTGAAYDLLLSNPPYIAEEEYDGLDEDVRAGDPLKALVAGPQGTEFYAPLAGLAVRTLRPGGKIMVEVGAGQAKEVSAVFKKSGLVHVGTVKDLGGIDRVVTGEKY